MKNKLLSFLKSFDQPLVHSVTYPGLIIVITLTFYALWCILLALYVLLR